MKPEAVRGVMERHRKGLSGPEERPRGGMAMQLVDAFRKAGIPIEVTAPKPSRRRRDKAGRVER